MEELVPSVVRVLRFPFVVGSVEFEGPAVDSGALEVEGIGDSSIEVSKGTVFFSEELGGLFGDESEAAAAAADPGGGIALRFTRAGLRAQRPCTDLLRAFPFYSIQLKSRKCQSSSKT